MGGRQTDGAPMPATLWRMSAVCIRDLRQATICSGTGEVSLSTSASSWGPPVRGIGFTREQPQAMLRCRRFVHAARHVMGWPLFLLSLVAVIVLLTRGDKGARWLLCWCSYYLCFISVVVCPSKIDSFSVSR
jgi:hypothetical protein